MNKHIFFICVYCCLIIVPTQAAKDGYDLKDAFIITNTLRAPAYPLVTIDLVLQT